MIKNILNFLNFFRVNKRLKNHRLTYFSDGPIKDVSKIDNLDKKRIIVKNILKFLKNCNLSYENIKVDENLKVAGLWKNYLMDKKDQKLIYETMDVDKIVLFHENMFFNCLIKGMWNYNHYETANKDYNTLLLFLKDLELYKIIFEGFSDLSNTNEINKWGYKFDNKKFHYLDISSKIQKNLILNSLNLIGKSKTNILEIGGGFGSLAERLFESEKINSYTNVDIPSSLVTAYYYLATKYGEDIVELIDTKSRLDEKLNLDEKKIFLIPSAFYSEIKKYEKYDLLCNFASFSEMDFETVKNYLENLPKSINIIVTSNSNSELKYKNSNNFKEIKVDKFPIPKKFVLGFSSVQIPFYSNWRYKTQIWLKSPLNAEN